VDCQGIFRRETVPVQKLHFDYLINAAGSGAPWLHNAAATAEAEVPLISKEDDNENHGKKSKETNLKPTDFWVEETCLQEVKV
jgi:hypothetical protein